MFANWLMRTWKWLLVITDLILRTRSTDEDLPKNIWSIIENCCEIALFSLLTRQLYSRRHLETTLCFRASNEQDLNLQSKASFRWTKRKNWARSMAGFIERGSNIIRSRLLRRSISARWPCVYCVSLKVQKLTRAGPWPLSIHVVGTYLESKNAVAGKRWAALLVCTKRRQVSRRAGACVYHWLTENSASIRYNLGSLFFLFFLFFFNTYIFLMSHYHSRSAARVYET